MTSPTPYERIAAVVRYMRQLYDAPPKTPKATDAPPLPPTRHRLSPPEHRSRPVRVKARKRRRQITVAGKRAD